MNATRENGGGGDVLPFRYGEERECVVEGLGPKGDGRCTVDGVEVRVPFVLPGERVRVRIYRMSGAVAEADLIEVIEPSPERVEPVCRYYGECGGCQFQHWRGESQLEWKRVEVVRMYQSHGLSHVPVRPVIASPRWYGYRSKLTPHFDRPKKALVYPIGFRKHASKGVIVDVERCEIATEAINRAFPVMRAEVLGTRHKRGATLLLRSVGEEVLRDANALVEEEVGGIRFRYAAGSFFQNNPFMLPIFLKEVMGMVKSTGLPVLVDAYCGSGLFSLALAGAMEKVYGVEISSSSVDSARENGERNGIANAVFIHGDATKIFGEIAEDAGRCCLIVDPPRKGCSEDFLGQVLNWRARAVLYVSCNPATQAADLERLQEGYDIEYVQPFDFFPQTAHVEAVAVLQRKER